MLCASPSLIPFYIPAEFVWTVETRRARSPPNTGQDDTCVCVCVRVVERVMSSSHVNTPADPHPVSRRSTAARVKSQSDSGESFSLSFADCGSAALCLPAAGVKPFCRNPTNLDRSNSVTRSPPAQSPKPKHRSSGAVHPVCVSASAVSRQPQVTLVRFRFY